MSSFNKVILLGNLTRTPELRTLPKGTSICQFGLAVNRSFKTEAGENREEVTFVDLEAWGKTAEIIAKHLAKGRAAMFEGRLKLDTWEDKKTGEKRSKLKVVVESFRFIGGREDAPVPAQSAPAGTGPAASAEASEDVPF
jgi:single-strand DNA-binding protein